LTRRVIWPAVTLILMSVAFGAGKVSGQFRALPAIVATLPGDEAEFSRELDDRIRERFLIGTSEDKLIDYLKSERFLPEWRRRNEDNSSSFVQDGLICEKAARVFWRADAEGLLTKVGGAYESHCL
jgi:hypothetical protein